MTKKDKTLCIIQARVRSSRLPNKVLMEVNNKALLEYEIARVRLAKEIDKIVVATGIGKENDAIEKLCQKLGVDCFRGSEDNVLDRYYQCSLQYPDYSSIIRLTGDCPLVDPKIIDRVVELFYENDFDYSGNVSPPTFPDGMDVEIFSRQALASAARQAKLASEREHITQFMLKNNDFKKGNLLAKKDYSHIRLTVDYPEDFAVIKFLIEQSKVSDDYLQFISLLENNPQIIKKNKKIIRNSGLIESIKKEGQKGKQ